MADPCDRLGGARQGFAGTASLRRAKHNEGQHGNRSTISPSGAPCAAIRKRLTGEQHAHDEMNNQFSSISRPATRLPSPPPPPRPPASANHSEAISTPPLPLARLTLVGLFVGLSWASLLVILPLVGQLTLAAETSTAQSGSAGTGTVAAQSSNGGDPFAFEYDKTERDPQFWAKSGRQALDAALRAAPISRRAKNSIVFIGDGMSLPTITAARILNGQLMNRSGEEDQLSFESLQNVALIKTYNIDQQVPDSAATATAILTGVKANFYTLGVNGNVRLNDTNCARIQANKVSSILRQAQEAGKSTGIVTNTRITHATPAAAYAHTSNRRWECDAYMPRNLDQGCKDIARQLIEDEPGSRLNVIMGGGRRCFFGHYNVDPGPTGQPGQRLDGRNLINEWLDRRKLESNTNYAFVNSTYNMKLVSVEKTDYLLGLFSYSHMAYEELRDASQYGEPSLAEMTEMAIKILSKNPNGYLLLVEGGRIDHAHHENVAGVALRETIGLSWAVQMAKNMVDPRETLMAVTSDHAHALTINGIAPRGNPILGLSRYRENSTQTPYTTLLYGNGPGHKSPRPDPTEGPNSTTSPYYVQYAAVHQEEAFHDGSDVAIFASGPFAHLFHGVQEQSYIAHVIAYAMCIGDYQTVGHCQQPLTTSVDEPPGVGASDLGEPTAAGSDQIGAAYQAAADTTNRLNQHHQQAATVLTPFGRSPTAGAPIVLIRPNPRKYEASLFPRSGAPGIHQATTTGYPGELFAKLLAPLASLALSFVLSSSSPARQFRHYDRAS